MAIISPSLLLLNLGLFRERKNGIVYTALDGCCYNDAQCESSPRDLIEENFMNACVILKYVEPL